MPLPDALGTSRFVSFCFSLFDVPTACCGCPSPNQRLHCMFQDSMGWSDKEGKSVCVAGEGVDTS